MLVYEMLIAEVLHTDLQTVVLRMDAHNSLQGKEWLHGEIILKVFLLLFFGQQSSNITEKLCLKGYRLHLAFVSKSKKMFCCSSFCCRIYFPRRCGKSMKTNERIENAFCVDFTKYTFMNFSDLKPSLSYCST